MVRIYAGVAVAAVAALLGGTAAYVYFGQPKDAFAACRGGQIGGGDIGGPFTLIDAKGAAVTDQQVLDKPSLVYFGYTFCPDVCPFDMARNAEATDILEERGIEVQPVFITIDPDRDTPEVVGDFTENIHPRAIGLTGSAEQIKAAAQAYKAYYKKPEPADEFYMMDHSAFTYLMLPGRGFADFYKREATAEQIADGVACFAAAAADAP